MENTWSMHSDMEKVHAKRKRDELEKDQKVLDIRFNLGYNELIKNGIGN